ncbi:hypothetical protein MLD38_015892 [Melastoma candidum]|uniref:Uncharacterized protein n=1 Tax=Melastoma candidum TaxID=119954 RepID=A0ACB9RKQ0_9MYRT|nr:hypothetical protein MLD38_015892 [Melastoma candidum]
MAAESLPDDLWRKILEIGAKTTKNSSGFDRILSYRDICLLSITCRRFRRLSGEDSLWSHLLASDFVPLANPIPAYPSGAYKSAYRIRFEKETEKKRAAHRRAVLRKESQITQHLSRIRNLEVRLSQEVDKLKNTSDEFANLLRARQASVALNVWQPDVVVGRHKQVVMQSPVRVEARMHVVDMELKLCKKQIGILRKSRDEEKKRLDLAKKELESIMYHPLREYETNNGTTSSRKRLKK